MAPTSIAVAMGRTAAGITAVVAQSESPTYRASATRAGASAVDRSSIAIHDAVAIACQALDGGSGGIGLVVSGCRHPMVAQHLPYMPDFEPAAAEAAAMMRTEGAPEAQKDRGAACDVGGCWRPISGCICRRRVDSRCRQGGVACRRGRQWELVRRVRRVLCPRSLLPPAALIRSLPAVNRLRSGSCTGRRRRDRDVRRVRVHAAGERAALKAQVRALADDVLAAQAWRLCTSDPVDSSVCSESGAAVLTAAHARGSSC